MNALKKITNYFKQEAQAEDWHRQLTDAKKLRELAAKHNVTITMPIHDEMIVEGKGPDVANFLEEYTAFVTELREKGSIPTHVDGTTKEW